MNNFKLTLFICLLSLFCTNNSFAQIPDGTFCPNIIATDINGEEHNVYNLLAEGYKVVIDISATWCGPCWNYHETHALHNLHEQYGPNGTQEVFVLFIEGDEDTDLEDLQGTGSTTVGDWITGTPFPIIDGGENIVDLFEIIFYPTIFTVCGDGKIYETDRLTTEEYYDYITDLDCSTVNSDVAVGFSSQDVNFCEGPVDVSVDLINVGNIPLTQATITMSGCDECPISQYWNAGILNYFEYTPIVFENVVADEDMELVFSIDFNDENLTNNQTNAVIQISHVEATVEWNIDFTTDCAPFNNYWEVLNDADEVVATEGDFQFSYHNYNTSFTLPAGGCYHIVLYDSYDDGLNGSSLGCPGGNGYFHCYTTEGTILLTDGTDHFGELAGNAIVTAPPVSIDEKINNTVFFITPNPASENINIDVKNLQASKAVLKIQDIAGRSIFSQQLLLGANTFKTTLDISHLKSGIYLVELQTEHEQLVQKLVIE